MSYGGRIKTMATWYARQMVSGNWDIADDETGKTVARTETEEHARLIEAAPEMLDYLVSLVADADEAAAHSGDDPTAFFSDYDTVRAIVKKAKGE